MTSIVRSIVLLPLLFAFSVAHAQTCDGVFRENGPISLEGLDGRVTVRTASACFKSGYCMVLLNKPRNRPTMSRADINAILGRTGRLINHEVSGNPSVNCHGFSCGVIGIPGLPRKVWIDAKDLIVLLKEFFQPTGRKYETGEFHRFATEPSLAENDLVIMANFRRNINHTGILRHVSVNGRVENWVESKLDESVVVLTPLENLLGHYQVEYVSVYRYSPR